MAYCIQSFPPVTFTLGAVYLTVEFQMSLEISFKQLHRNLLRKNERMNGNVEFCSGFDVCGISFLFVPCWRFCVGNHTLVSSSF